MPSWWSSIESVSKFNSTLQLFIAFSAIITASLGLLIWLSSHQLTKLRNDKEKQEQARLLKAENETWILCDELKITSNKLTDSEKTIKSLTIESTKAQKTIEDLNVKAKKAERGISSTYDFNGAKRETAGGRISVVAGQETGIFVQMVNLEKEKKYPELLTLCKSQIERTPEWLTPYLFLGLAQANMGLTNDAISNFEYVTKNAPGDPNYQRANEFIKRLKGN